MSVESSKQMSCRLCLSIINDTDFEIIEEIIRGILQDVLPCLDMETNDKQMICRTCHVKLIDAFNFKSMCIATEDVISSYTNPEQMPMVELKDVYLKEEGNFQLTDISENQIICRLCMQLITCGFVSLNEVDVDIILNYIPNVNVYATNNPIICGLCFDSLLIHSSFLKKCLDVQVQYTHSYIKTEEIDIKAEESDQDSDSSSHNLFEGTVRNNRGKRIFGDSEKTIDECVPQCRVRKVQIDEHKSRIQKSGAPIDALSTEDEYKNKFNDLIRKDACEPIRKGTIEMDMTIKPSCVIHKNPSEIRIYKYGKYDFQTKDKCSLTLHELKQDVSKAQMYKCSRCNYETKRKGNINRHQLTHKDLSQIQMYKCDVCSYKSKYKIHLKQHELTHSDPSDVQMYKCHVCNYATKYKTTLKMHLLIHKDPSETQMYECDMCRYRTKKKSSIKLHQLTHKDLSEIPTFKCDVCSYEARHKKSLDIHQLTHKDPSEIQLYKCNVCNYETKYKTSLKTHMLLHKDPSEVQVYSCTVCKFVTKYKSALKRHLIIHSSLKSANVQE